MDFLRRHLLTIVLLSCAAVVGGELWWLGRSREDAQRALAALEQAAQEREWLARQTPAPTAAVEQAIAAERTDLRDRVAALRGRLQTTGSDPAPSRSLDAYFQLAALVERARAQAIAARISLPPDERFGFAAYANEGPAPDQLATVHRQQRAVQQLLEPLFEARPLALLAVRRESPAGRANAAGDDYFLLEPAASLERPGIVDTDALRLEFTGQTSTLRAFLGGLADLRDPVVVRGVDVEPWPGRVPPRARAGGEDAVPVVRQSLSKFAVTLEFLHLAARLGEPAS